MSSAQLTLELEPPAANPNARMFEDGQPRRLMWCSDSARLGGPCPYPVDRVPLGGCCKEFREPVAE